MTEDNNEFIAEFEKMDLSNLVGKIFSVAVSQSERDDHAFLCSTLRGPMDFFEMVEDVGTMWAKKSLHAHVLIMEKDRDKPQEWLDENTIDYIEAHYVDICLEGVITGELTDEEFTCEAKILSDIKDITDGETGDEKSDE